MYMRSSRIDHLSSLRCAGVYFRRNFLFVVVTLPDPSILTPYLWNWWISIRISVLSHFLGDCLSNSVIWRCLPQLMVVGTWYFFSSTHDCSCGGFLKVLPLQIGSRSMFCVVDTCQVWWEWGFWPVCQIHTWLGRVLSLSSLFRYCNMAFWKLSTSRSPLGPVLLVIRCLMVLMPTSTQQSLCGKATELSDIFPSHVGRTWWCWQRIWVLHLKIVHQEFHRWRRCVPEFWSVHLLSLMISLQLT